MDRKSRLSAREGKNTRRRGTYLRDHAAFPIGHYYAYYWYWSGILLCKWRALYTSGINTPPESEFPGPTREP